VATIYFWVGKLAVVGDTFDLARHGAMGLPFVDDGAGDAVRQHGVMQAQRTARKTGRRQQHELRRWQHWHDDADQAERQRDTPATRQARRTRREL